MTEDDFLTSTKKITTKKSLGVDETNLVKNDFIYHCDSHAVTVSFQHFTVFRKKKSENHVLMSKVFVIISRLSLQ